jgi:hypothetical protein
LNPAIRRCDSRPVVRSGGGSIPFSAERVRRSRVGDTSENCLFFPRDNWGECGRQPTRDGRRRRGVDRKGTNQQFFLVRG